MGAVRKTVILAAALFVAVGPGAGNALACGDDGSGFLPENDLKIPVHSSRRGRALISPFTVSEQQFNSILDKINVHYAPIVRSAGGTLSIVRSWSDPTVNAYADRQGSTWRIRMFGGLARHPAITPDGFAVVACHELGHHLGGVPKYPGQWAANEGQADYFANLKCLRRVWEKDDNRAVVAGMQVPETVTRSCERSFSDANTIALCQRAALAGLSSANLSRALDGSPTVDFTTPDPNVVQTTYNPHPKAQCRLDTYYQAAICPVRFEEELGQTDPTVGTCSVERGATFGTRPLCWYKPGDGGGGPNPPPQPPTDDIAPTPTIGGSTDVTVRPGQVVAIDYDVSAFANADGAYMEIVGPNREFQQPNGTPPDPYRLFWGAQPGKRGRFTLTRPLPAFGGYRARVIPLTANGTAAAGRFSNPMTIRLQGGWLF